VNVVAYKGELMPHGAPTSVTLLDTYRCASNTLHCIWRHKLGRTWNKIKSNLLKQNDNDVTNIAT